MADVKISALTAASALTGAELIPVVQSGTTVKATYNQLRPLTDSHILVGNASNLATDVALSGDATIANTGALTVANSAVIGKVLTGYSSGAGTVAATDTILQAVNKLNGNTALKAPAASPSFTGVIDLDKALTITVASGYGWNDLLSDITIKGTGAQDPSWTTFRNGISGYAFSASAINETHHRFHILHDYAVGTVIYPHVHWSPNTTSTGVVRWGFEYTIAQGHQQGAGSTFGATTTVYVEQTVSVSSQYQHFVAEVSLANAIPATQAQVDAVILMRIFRDASHVNDTFPDPVFAWTADCHYQSNTLSTKNKAPNFYA